jgi:hypothetical protein
VVVKAIVDALQGHPWGIPGMEFEPKSPVFWVQYGALHLLFFLGTFVTTAVSALASRLLIAGGFAVFKFGPEGVSQLSRLLTGATALVAALFALWAVFG